MTGECGWLRLDGEGAQAVLTIGGVWTVRHGADLERRVDAFALPEGATCRLNLSDISGMDTTGAMLLHRLASRLGDVDWDKVLADLPERFRPLLVLARKAADAAPGDIAYPPRGGWIRLVERLGRATVEAAGEGRDLLNFMGVVTIVFVQSLMKPSRLRPKALISQIEQTGLNAMLIVGLLQFLIGVVLTYLMAGQFKKFGAEVLTVNLIGLTVLQEAGVLITAILLAGRSGSAFTAQIGTMKVNEEIDAMQTLGLDPVEVLVLPRILALVITLPLLTFFADICGILGGALSAMLALDISMAQFFRQLHDAVTVKDFLIGMVKAPVHAVIIALVGCYEGLKVQRSAESVGRLTTKSVVESIVLVIVATAVFSILFSILGIR